MRGVATGVSARNHPRSWTRLEGVGQRGVSLPCEERCRSEGPHRENWPALPAAGGETQAAFERRSIPPEPPPHRENWRFAALGVAFRSKYTRASSPGGGSSLTRLVSRAPRPHREDSPLSALTRVPPQAASARAPSPEGAYLMPRRFWPGRKRTTRPRGIPTGSPVRGLRATPVLRGAAWNTPNLRSTTR